MLALFTSCATIMNGNQQKVTVFTNNSKSKVYINDQEQGSGKDVEAKFKRDLNVHQIKIITDGFKDQYLVNYQTTKSPWNILSWFPFGVLVFPPLTDVGPKIYNFDKEFISKEKLIPANKKSDTERYLFVKNTEINLNLKDLKITKINFNTEEIDEVNKAKKIDSITGEIEFNNTTFTKLLNDILVKNTYTDASSIIYKNKSNAALISASISKINLQADFKSFCGKNMPFLKAEAEITWNFLDVYGQTIYSKKTTTKSGDFSFDFYKKETTTAAIEDAIAASFYNFMSEKSVKDNLKKSKFGIEPKLKPLELFKAAYVENLDDALNSTVTIKVKNGYGSGFKVGKDGYIVTNFNVVANSEDRIIVITKDNKEYEGKIIRKNESLDLALIRVDATFDKHFEIAKENNLTAGDAVFLLGTPALEQGQTSSKGIASGYKENGWVKLIQTDANINAGNSGGPMINKDGKLIGIVNTKFNEAGIKNLSFAIPAEFLISSLNIK